MFVHTIAILLYVSRNILEMETQIPFNNVELNEQ